MGYRRSDDRFCRSRIAQSLREIEQLSERVEGIAADLLQDDPMRTSVAAFALGGVVDFLSLAKETLSRARDRLPNPEPDHDIRKALSALRGGGS